MRLRNDSGNAADRVLAKSLSVIEMVFRQRATPVTVAPSDQPEGTVEGIDPDRIVVLGDWNAVGLGVATFQLSLAACFARDLAARTGRGAEWVAMPVDGFRLAGVPPTVVIAVDRIAVADIVILVLGAAETMGFAPPKRWRADMIVAIESLLTVMGPSASLIVAEIPPLDNLGVVSGFVSRELGKHVRLLNSVTREITEEYPHCVLSAFPEALTENPWETTSGTFRFSHTYSVWAASMVRSLAFVV